MTDTSIEAIEHLDFDFEPPCESNEHGLFGTGAAVWRCIRDKCGCVDKPSMGLFCDGCLEGKKQAGYLYCDSGCGMTWEPPMTAYISITRIKP